MEAPLEEGHVCFLVSQAKPEKLPEMALQLSSGTTISLWHSMIIMVGNDWLIGTQLKLIIIPKKIWVEKINQHKRCSKKQGLTLSQWPSKYIRYHQITSSFQRLPTMSCCDRLQLQQESSLVKSIQNLLTLGRGQITKSTWLARCIGFTGRLYIHLYRSTRKLNHSCRWGGGKNKQSLHIYIYQSHASIVGMIYIDKHIDIYI